METSLLEPRQLYRLPQEFCLNLCSCPPASVSKTMWPTGPPSLLEITDRYSSAATMIQTPLFHAVMPSKAKYYESEMEFQRQRNDPNRPYQVPPPQYPPTNAAARGYQNETFVPSSLEQTPSSRKSPALSPVSVVSRQVAAELSLKRLLPQSHNSHIYVTGCD